MEPRPTEIQTKPRRMRLKDELLLALLPTAAVLLTLALVESLGGQHLLCATLASSAFLIYLDPEHETNAVRTLVLSQMMAAGWDGPCGPSLVRVMCQPALRCRCSFC
jgi:hypothetical protein